jgi:hypothetical protein
MALQKLNDWKKFEEMQGSAMLRAVQLRARIGRGDLKIFGQTDRGGADGRLAPNLWGCHG